MNIKYTKLGEINTQHAYFKGGISQYFRFSPLFNTSNLLNQNGIRIRPLNKESKIELYINETFSSQAAKSWQSDPIHLFFALDYTDPYFLSYTDLPIHSPLIPTQISIKEAQQIYFFSNTVSALDKTTITDKTTRVLLLPPHFNITYSSNEVSGDKIIVRKSNGSDSILELPVDSSGSVEIQEIQVQLSEKALKMEELYEIVIGDTDPIPFKYMPTPLSDVHLGILQLTLGPAGDATPFINADSSDPILKTESYFINFANRAVQWQYNIIGDQYKAEDLDILSIDLNQEGNSRAEILSNVSTFPQSNVVHQKKEERTLPTGQKVIPILLEEAIPLSEEQEKAFILKVNKSGDMPISIKLPTASAPFQLKPSSKNNADEAYLIDIFVYL